MTQPRESRELIKRYLLGDLDEESLGQVEERLLLDEALQEEVAVTQQDLIDEYVAGLLSARRRELFESHFLSTPERLHNLRLSQALIKYAEANVASAETEAVVTTGRLRKLLQSLGARRLALGAISGVLLLFLGYGLWKAYQPMQLEQRLTGLMRDRQAVEQELARLNKRPAEQNSSTLAITLRLLVMRDSDETRRAVVTEGETILQLRLELEEDNFPVYQAVVKTEDGIDIFTIKDLKAVDPGEGKIVVVNLPSRILPTGDYQIHLLGITTDGRPVTVGTYPFQIVLK